MSRPEDDAAAARAEHFPVGGSISRTALSEQLHPTLHALRTSEPISWVPALGGWFVTDYRSALAVLRDTSRFTVDDERFSTGRVVGPSMLSTDGEAHRRHRHPFESMFRPIPVSEAASNMIVVAETLIDGFKDRDRIELREAYAAPLAVKVICDFLGLTSPDSPPSSPVEQQLLSCYRRIVSAVAGLTPDLDLPAEGIEAVVELGHLIRDATGPEVGTADARETLVTVFQGGRLTVDETLSNIAVILFGAIETSEAMTANALYHLLGEPSEIRRLVDTDAESRPAVLRSVISESLRMEPAASLVDRYATSDTTLSGVDINDGDLVVVSLAGANRDPAVFPDPDRFLPQRSNVDRQLAFARGPHTCLGIHLARLQTTIAVEQLIRRFPALRCHDRRSAAPSGVIFRKPKALFVGV